MSKKYEYLTHYTIGHLEGHNTIKDMLLFEFEKAEKQSTTLFDNYYFDNITKLDWHLATNFERKWTKILLPFLNNYLTAECENRGQLGYTINELWFQQYDSGGTHGWHTHGSNYTAVYYVEFPQGSPKTQIVMHDDVVVEANVKEGDILIFPSWVIHRAPVNNSDKRKTIVSFNFTFTGPTLEKINHIKKKNNIL